MGARRGNVLLSVALAASTAALLLVIAGCGGGGHTSTGGGPSPSASSEAAPPPPEEGAAPQGGEASIEEFGEEAKGSEREAILAAFEGYLGALAQRDYGGACAHLDARLHESLARLLGNGPDVDCAQALPKLLSPNAPAIARIEANGALSKVRLQGERGFVVFHAPGARLYQLPMVREEGEWKAGLVAASILVPSEATLGR